jgi:type IV pilus assembly protein PilC
MWPVQCRSMSNYAYVAVDPQGVEARGILDVADQSEALRRIREMGLFPTKVSARTQVKRSVLRARTDPSPQPSPLRKGRGSVGWAWSIQLFGRRIKPAALALFTRQLSTLVEAGLPLLRGLRILQEQEENQALRRVIGDLSLAIESGSSFAEAVEWQPKIFNRLYVNMVKAGEIGGALEVTLTRLAEFMEKAQKIKGKVKAAMFYPCAVLTVAAGVVALLMVFVVPKFKEVFNGLLEGAQMPAFTRFVLGISEAIKNHIIGTVIAIAALCVVFLLGLRTNLGRRSFDQFKLTMPVLGPVFRKAAISRFARTLGTLVGSGVPILQALTIVKETAANVVLCRVISSVHDNVKQGDPIAPTLKASRVFPAMVAGMVDVGEQTGALPEMLMKIADNYDEQVDNAASAMTSLLEPIMIVFLAVVVGSIVIAMFLPLVVLINPEGVGAPKGVDN